MKCFERLVMHNIKTSLPNTVHPLQFAYHPNRSTDDAISATLHLALTHLENKDYYDRMLFIDFSSAFNTIIPQQLINKLNLLGLNNSLCNWILDFLTGRPQSVRVGRNTSSTITLRAVCSVRCSLCCWPTTALPSSAQLTSCITVWYGNCSAADCKTLQRTVNTAAKITLHDAPAKPIVSWRTPPILPTVSSSSYHQEDSTGASEPAPPDCSTAFSPRLWEPWTQLTPPHSETPYKPPTSWNMDHITPPPPQPYHITEKKLSKCFVQFTFKVCYTQVSGTVQITCSNTLSSIHTRHFTHTTVRT